MKRIIGCLLVGLGLFAVGYLLLNSAEPTEVYQYSEDYVQMKEIPSLLDFCFYTKKEWEEKIKTKELGEVLTAEGLQWILDQTGTTEYINYKNEGQKRVSRTEWNGIYGKILDLLDEKGEIQIVDEVILKKETGTLVCPLKNYEFSIEDITIEPMTAMGFYVKGKQIIGIHSLKSKSAAIKNVYVKKVMNGTLEFLTEGEAYEIKIAIEEPEKVENHVCDLLWEDGAMAKVQVKEDTIQGNLIAVNDKTIEIEGYGEILRAEKLPVYKTYGTIEQKEVSDIVIANMKVEYVVAKDSVEAILLVEPAQISKIRVLLLAEDNSVYHEEIYIGASGEYEIKKKKKKTKKSADTLVKASNLFAAGKGKSLTIHTMDEAGELFLCDEAGNRLTKGYPGSLEIRKHENGFTVVNELPMEQYLCAVVPSEMPASYELEALKAQAICARSYAYIQLERGDYAAFGAHVDDSTNYQVYNKQDKNEKTTTAVLDTTGVVLQYGGTTAEAYYFSTSAGVIGNGEAWNLTADPKYGYLQNGLVKEGGGEVDLSTEEAFKKFITELDPLAYESAMPYFRWKAIGDYTSEEVQGKIKTILNTRKERTPKDILFCDNKNRQVESIEEFGNLVRISVTKRSVSGVILQLQLEYEKGIVFVGNEYNIRALLGTGLTELTLADGSLNETTLLPSAYTTLIPLENGTYSMTGGGCGHGIGMSQNGAAAMAAQGKSCKEILEFFFQDIQIINIS